MCWQCLIQKMMNSFNNYLWIQEKHFVVLRMQLKNVTAIEFGWVSIHYLMACFPASYWQVNKLTVMNINDVPWYVHFISLCSYSIKKLRIDQS